MFIELEHCFFVFQLTIRAEDAFGTTGVERQDNYAVLTLNVDSNLNAPVLTAPGSPSYQATVEINENIDFSYVVYDANAVDADLTVRTVKNLLMMECNQSKHVNIALSIRVFFSQDLYRLRFNLTVFFFYSDLHHCSHCQDFFNDPFKE